MAQPVKRTYNAPRRLAAAAETRQAILKAAKRQLETRGWSGATIRAIATDAQVSPKTVEALFGAKSALLSAVVDYTFRGGHPETPVSEGETARAVEAAPDVETMLARYAEHVVTINARSARLVSVVEAAAGADKQAAALWARMTRNRRSGARWAAETMLSKPDAPQLDAGDVESIFLVGLNAMTYQVLTGELGLTNAAARSWLHVYYRRMLLA
jgi:TetR/AcrR family transcriptional regulator, regulator of autoinduction and epiphytic fitness